VIRVLAALPLAIVVVSVSRAEVPEQARTSIDRIVGGKGAYVADEGVYKLVLRYVLDIQVGAIAPASTIQKL
jgi:hypothetical protein